MKKKQIIVGGLVVSMILGISYYIRIGRTCITIPKGNPKRDEAARKVAGILKFSIKEDENSITLSWI